MAVGSTILTFHATPPHPIAQELLARASGTNQAAATQIEDLFIFNGGIFPALHRPVLLQRLLLSPWLGPLLSHYAMGAWTFAKGVRGVFSPEHPPSEKVLADMWEVGDSINQSSNQAMKQSINKSIKQGEKQIGPPMARVYRILHFLTSHHPLHVTPLTDTRACGTARGRGTTTC